MFETAPRLYLIMPPSVKAAGFAAVLAAALDGGDVACVLYSGEDSDGDGLRELMRLTQKRDAAFLVRDPQIAINLGADGVHVDGVGPALDRALAVIKPQGIVGVGSLSSRDDAMRAGEAGADYVMFGAPWEDTALETVRERASWWAEIFNTPCVAYARDLSEVAAVTATGAEFVALSASWSDSREAKGAVDKAMRLMTREPAA